MQTDIEGILDRLERCELELQASRGHIKALEYGLHLLVTTHPSPRAMSSLWQHVIADLADLHGGSTGSSPLFESMLRHALGEITAHIQGAIDR